MAAERAWDDAGRRATRSATPSWFRMLARRVVAYVELKVEPLHLVIYVEEAELEQARLAVSLWPYEPEILILFRRTRGLKGF